MADFSFLSDTDDSAVEELLSQTQDLCVLEQISAINCSSFTDSLLPSELESRFQKLKSFPLTNSNSKPKPKPTSSFDLKPPFKSDHDSAIFSPSKHDPKRDFDSSPKSRLQNGNSPDSSSSSTISEEILSPKKVGNSNSKRNPEPGSNSFSPPWKSSPSPPRKTGCFWCSPKKSSEKKSSLDWGKDSDFLSDLGIFSTKEQKKTMKKAIKEEERINKEAEKIVKWAKQASARMDISDIEDEFSDHESHK